MKARTGLTWAAIILLTVLPLWFAVAPPAEPGPQPPRSTASDTPSTATKWRSFPL